MTLDFVNCNGEGFVLFNPVLGYLLGGGRGFFCFAVGSEEEDQSTPFFSSPFPLFGVCVWEGFMSDLCYRRT